MPVTLPLVDDDRQSAVTKPPLQVRSDGPAYCRRCGYDLRGMTTDRCTECGIDLRRGGVSTKRRVGASMLARSTLFLLLYVPVMFLVSATIEPVLPRVATTTVNTPVYRRYQGALLTLDCLMTMRATERPFATGPRVEATIELELSAEAALAYSTPGTDAPQITLRWDSTGDVVRDEAGKSLTRAFEELGMPREDAEIYADSLRRAVSRFLREREAMLVESFRDRPQMMVQQGVMMPGSAEMWRFEQNFSSLNVGVTRPYLTSWRLLLIGGGVIGLLLVASGIDLRPRRWRERTGKYA